MIITEILGGLGNQLFEYAHARFLSLRLKQDLQFDISFFDRYHRKDVYRLDKFNTNIKIASDDEIYRIKRKVRKPVILRRIYRKLGGSPYVNSKYHFDNERIDSCDIETLKYYDDLYISGYFGNQKYFIEIEDVIRKAFTLKKTLNLDNKQVLSQIKKSNSVSIHIRRGDYVNNNYFAEIPLNFYHKSVDYIERHYPQSTYFIFSDDLNWAKENLKLEQKTVFVDINNESTDYMELILMAACKHNIIANSTFSWWSGWLNNNPDKIVIAPQKWYNNKETQISYENGNLVPNNWIKL